ncbi:MAG: hypothetical protein R8G66_03645 [Cytophagales bacterium]|nr:hypothetical protein [Cytophagales bacterium]
MKKSTRLIVALVAAAITFGSLFAFVGTDHWEKYRHVHQHWHQHEDC